MAVELIEAEDGQRQVETGRGIVTKIDHGERNHHVKINATHTNLRHPVTGWLDSTFVETVRAAEASLAQGIELEYRIEVHRKRNVDPTIPVADLANTDKIRDLVALEPARQQAAPAPRPSEPSDGPDAPNPHPGPSERQEEPQSTESGPNRAPTPSTAQTGFHVRGAKGQTPGPKLAEGRPWEELNSDGSPNLGAYAVTAAAGMIDLAVEVLAEAGQAVTIPRIRGAAKSLLELADTIQAGVRPDGRVDRMDASHTRARGVLRTVLRYRPIPFADPPEAREQWRAEVIEDGVALLASCLELSGLDWRP